MGIEVVSGLSATRGAWTSPDFTFIWSATEQGSTLVVGCTFGGGTATNNYATATIPWGSTQSVTMSNQQNNSAIYVQGSVQALWSTNQNSYVVTFSGAMIEPNVNNVISSNENGLAVDSEPIIVAVYLAGSSNNAKPAES